MTSLSQVFTVYCRSDFSSNTQKYTKLSEQIEIYAFNNVEVLHIYIFKVMRDLSVKSWADAAPPLTQRNTTWNKWPDVQPFIMGF